MKHLIQLYILYFIFCFSTNHVTAQSMVDKTIGAIDTSKAEHYIWGQQCDGWHLVKSAGLSVIQERMPPATEEEKHYHKIARQFFYIISGEAEFEVESKHIILKQGQGLEIAPGLKHKIMNKTSKDLYFTVTSQPPSHGDRYKD